MTKGRLLFVVNDGPFFLSHRLPIALAAKAAGFEVHVATPYDADVHAQVLQHGLVPHDIALNRRGMNPLLELRTLRDIYRLYKQQQPDLVHLVTIKPVLYGGLVARLAKVNAVVAALTGLGYVQIATGLKGRMLRGLTRLLYRSSLGHKNLRVIFQNPDDQAVLTKMGVIPASQAVLIKGSGVDMTQFRPTANPESVPVVMLASRMLWDKGVGEFVAAAGQVLAKGVNARFVLVGSSDEGNPASIPERQLQQWAAQGHVEWWGRCTDMPSIFSKVHVVCLPSKYGEGVPKVLIEAAACGKPIVTTDTPGCREIVHHGDNGLLVPPANVAALAEALERLLEDPSLALKMGLNSRQIAVDGFSVETVIAQTLQVYGGLLSAGR